MGIDINSLEPNSHKYRAEKAGKAEGKKTAPIVDKSAIVSTKKPFGKKMAETFLTEDTQDVKSWLFLDVIIPGIKNTILDIIQMMFFGEVDSRRDRSRRRDRDRTSYSSYYKGSSYDSRYTSRREKHRDEYESDDRVDFRNIVLRNRDDAERVIEDMRGRIRKDGAASVADLLDLLDVAGRYTDNNWGWEDERDIGIRRVSSGYLIDVSDPRYLD